MVSVKSGLRISRGLNWASTGKKFLLLVNIGSGDYKALMLNSEGRYKARPLPRWFSDNSQSASLVGIPISPAIISSYLYLPGICWQYYYSSTSSPDGHLYAPAPNIAQHSLFTLKISPYPLQIEWVHHLANPFDTPDHSYNRNRTTP